MVSKDSSINEELLAFIMTEISLLSKHLLMNENEVIKGDEELTLTKQKSMTKKIDKMLLRRTTYEFDNKNDSYDDDLVLTKNFSAVIIKNPEKTEGGVIPSRIIMDLLAL